MIQESMVGVLLLTKGRGRSYFSEIPDLLVDWSCHSGRSEVGNKETEEMLTGT